MKTDKTLVHFILMGGTIDSRWNKRLDAIELNKESAIPDYFEDYQLLDDTTFTQVCMKDSRELTAEDRKNMLKTIEESPSKNIIITHGRFTMPDSARYLKEHLKRKDQTIVFTAATTPLIAFDFSDAPFNLGYAFAKTQHLPAGIYVSLEGRSFTLEEVNEYIKQGKLHEVFSSEER
ncbi:hypothetical protein A3D83_00920 [Candidatus Daviesbacteria bacterium RIFCSPHIGHO2_02_FULL_41_10]|uniref:L-asparaginase N-terminal domain-containing protein n=1 Tax=Candidatus Daviesbacteria bacterium RIFCSPHIGHO2_02_FULL_41_10 TaxID=1797774 RepID=A0A1F5JY13_9BACT|nr:MAG: hypothetical protein A3D83_00920 [Candidatus Daviesbacteria bacterium RIFCSPHIGHO2_02_FULL_41_10]